MAGNPLLGGPMAMLQNSHIGQLITMKMSGQDPMPYVQKMMGQNADFGSAINAMNGKDQSQINDMMAKAAKDRGVDLTQVAKQINLPPDVAKRFNIPME